MAGTFTPTGTFSNLTRLQLEQLRRADFFAGGKALTVGDSALLPEGVVGPGNVNAEPFYTSPALAISDIRSVTPPGKPGDFLQKNLDIYPNSSTSAAWYGPDIISTGFNVSATANTVNPNVFTDTAADFVTDGVLPGDLILVEMPSQGNHVGIVGSVDSPTQLTASLVTGGSWANNAITYYQVVRPNAVQLFAVPGSGPTGQEQTFLTVIPGSTLHNTVGPTVDDINADRVPNLVSPRFAQDSTVDRADGVYPAPAPFGSLSTLGYRVVLYPDNGSGTAPDLTNPIATLSPVIDPAIPADDQRVTFDFDAGVVRFSCAPALGGQIKVPGGVNPTTGRLNLYAVFWAHDFSNQDSVQRLFVPNTNPNGSVSDQSVVYSDSTTWNFITPVSSVALSGVSPNNLINRGETVQIPQPSVLQKLNTINASVGDGSITHGDWNGSTAIQDAINAMLTRFPSPYTTFVLHIKSGNYLFQTSTVTIPANVEIILQGESKKGVNIQMLSPAECITITSGGQLRMENLTIQGFSGIGFGILINGSIRLKNCAINDTPLRFVNPTPLRTLGSFNFFEWADVCIAEDCEIEASNQTGIFAYPIQVFQNTSTPSKGYRFRSCSITGCGTGEAIMLINTSATPGAGTTVTGISFDKCRIACFCCFSTSTTQISKAGGVLYIDPSGSTDALTVDDVAFIDCEVQGVANGLGSVVLMHVSPLPFDASTAASNRALIGKVAIRGGTWMAPASRGTDFIPLFLCCFQPIVTDVRFIGGGTPTNSFGVGPGFQGNGLYTDPMKIALKSVSQISSSPGTAPVYCGWATFSASGTAIENQITAGKKMQSALIVRNVTFENFHRKAGYGGVIALQGPGKRGGIADVNGITIPDMIKGAVNNSFVAYSWVFIQAGGSGSSSNMGTTGEFRNINCITTDTTTSAAGGNPDQWAAVAFITVAPEGRLTVIDCLVNPAKIGGTDSSTTSGVSIYWGWNTLGNAPVGNLGPLTLDRIRVYNCWKGIDLINPITTGGPIGPVTVRNFTMEATDGNNAVAAITYGIRLNSSSVPFHSLIVEGCNIDNSVFDGSNFTGISFTGAWTRKQGGYVTNNYVRATYGGGVGFAGATSYGIEVISVGAPSTPAFSFFGNRCTSFAGGFDNSSWYIRLQEGNGSVLADNTLYGGANALYQGAQIGHSITNTQQYRFVTNNPMVYNEAVLKTPS